MSEAEATVVETQVVTAEPARTEGAQNTAEQATASTPTGETPEKPTDQAPEKQGKSRFERRLDRAYRRAAEQQARADFLERQLNELRTAPKPAADPGAPRLEQFNSIEEYDAAVRTHERERALKEHEAKQRETAHKEYRGRLVSEWESKAAKAEAKYDDFDEVVGELVPTTPWAVAVMEADNAGEIAYYLGKHLDEARAIAAMTDIAQVRAIGRLEAKLSAEPPKPKEPSKAPAPITPVTGTKSVASDDLADDDDMKTFIRKREKQLGRR